MDCSEEHTPKGKLPPFEVAQAIAYDGVIATMEKHLGKTCWEILGESKAAFTAKRLKVKGGGNPGEDAVKKVWKKTKDDPKWFLAPRNPGGRPPQISGAQKQAIADKAMELKAELKAPTPEKIRACLPGTTINKKTQEPISDYSIRQVFQTMCYDEDEDDPWQYLNALQQDCLTDAMKPGRVKTAQFVEDNITKTAAFNFVAIDPCFSMLPTQQDKSDLLKIAHMGNRKWMSKKSRRKGSNLRAPKTAKTQKTAVTIVPWTPVFTRGRLKLVVLTSKGAKLNNSTGVASFVLNELPRALQEMQEEWGWTSIPRVVLHDKASYFVNSRQHCLNQTFATALHANKFTSWVENQNVDCKWLSPMLGDWYLHETVISHVRRLLHSRFGRKALYETPNQFAARMKKVEEYMNYEMGTAAPGEALLQLGRDMHKRSAELKLLRGERLPK